MTFAADHRLVREEICDIGRRLVDRGLVVAADGNISVRLNEAEILCTPTGMSKGRMTAEDICTIDLDGKQTGGSRRPSSESLLHLQVYRQRDDVSSIVHAHPPHVTAFALTRQAIPAGILPEVELFLGEVPMAGYATPGTPELANSIVPFVEKSNIVVLANHGSLAWDSSLERALWWTEILENYCRVLILSRTLGPPAWLTDEEMREVLAGKEEWGISDARAGTEFSKSDLRDHPLFQDTWERTGVQRTAFDRPK